MVHLLTEVILAEQFLAREYYATILILRSLTNTDILQFTHIITGIQKCAIRVIYSDNDGD